MPIFEYRCECGKNMDVLVRGGREPTTCTDAGEASDWCSREGKVAKQLSAPHVARSGGGPMYDLSSGSQVDAGSCGHCGQVPGSCASD
jgi:predicted nucleic acid-binding Zn ribbon protein